MSERIDLAKIVFTEHAINQFVDRSGDRGKNPEEAAREILKHAEKEPMNKGLVRRMIEHNCTYVEYWVSSGWRFIIKEENDILLVITIERIGGS